jgi:preprotein translocase subunit SecG
MIIYGLVIAIHVIVSLVLICVILLQAGRGGGLSESFGGSSTQTLFGTKTSVFLMRATAVAAVIYIITCLVLGVMTAHRGRSLVSKGAVTMPVGSQGPVQPFADEPLDY